MVERIGDVHLKRRRDHRDQRCRQGIGIGPADEVAEPEIVVQQDGVLAGGRDVHDGETVEIKPARVVDIANERLEAGAVGRRGKGVKAREPARAGRCRDRKPAGEQASGLAILEQECTCRRCSCRRRPCSCRRNCPRRATRLSWP